MRGVVIFLTAGLFYPAVILAQEDARRGAFTHEAECVAENDFIFFEDYYYTAGLDLFYRKLISPDSKLFNLVAGANKDSTKAIVQYRYGLKMFTPFNIETHATQELDRPYAGWNFASVGLSTFRRPDRGNRVELETGLVGRASGMEQLQLWVHKITTYDPPEGWDNQIRNEWIVNGYYTHFENRVLTGRADIVSQSFVQAGTGGNKLSQDVTLRLLRFNPINNSAFTQSRLSWDTKSKKGKEEIFIFAGAGIDYVISSVFIEGSLFKQNRSPFTVPAVPWVFRRNVGIMYSNPRFSCSAIFNHLTREVGRGTVHDYASFRLAVRF